MRNTKAASPRQLLALEGESFSHFRFGLKRCHIRVVREQAGDHSAHVRCGNRGAGGEECLAAVIDYAGSGCDDIDKVAAVRVGSEASAAVPGGHGKDRVVGSRIHRRPDGLVSCGGAENRALVVELLDDVLEEWRVAFTPQTQVENGGPGAERGVYAPGDVEGCGRRAVSIDIHGQNPPRSRCRPIKTLGETPKYRLAHR